MNLRLFLTSTRDYFAEKKNFEKKTLNLQGVTNFFAGGVVKK